MICLRNKGEAGNSDSLLSPAQRHPPAGGCAPCEGIDTTWRDRGKETQRRAAGKASGIDGTVRPKQLSIVSPHTPLMHCKPLAGAAAAQAAGECPSGAHRDAGTQAGLAYLIIKIITDIVRRLPALSVYCALHLHQVVVIVGLFPVLLSPEPFLFDSLRLHFLVFGAFRAQALILIKRK